MPKLWQCYTPITSAAIHQFWSNDARYCLQTGAQSTGRYVTVTYKFAFTKYMWNVRYWFLLSISDEMKRERDFYKNRNLPNPKDLPQNNEDDTFDRLNESHVESDYHRQDEQVNVCLECMSTNLNALKRRFLRCSSQATITHLKKFVAKKVLNGSDKYKEVSFSYRQAFCLYEMLQFRELDLMENVWILAGGHSMQRWTTGERSYIEICIHHTMAVSWSTATATVSAACWTIDFGIRHTSILSHFLVGKETMRAHKSWLKCV